MLADIINVAISDNVFIVPDILLLISRMLLECHNDCNFLIESINYSFMNIY